MRKEPRFKDGFQNPKAGQSIPAVANTAKLIMPLRGDTKLAVARIVTDLEVENERDCQIKLMRYPLIKGNKYSQLLDIRTNWFIKNFNFKHAEAEAWASNEFKAFFSTEDIWMSLPDPGHIFERLPKEAFSSLEQENILRSETKDSFKIYFLDQVGQ